MSNRIRLMLSACFAIVLTFAGSLYADEPQCTPDTGERDCTINKPEVKKKGPIVYTKVTFLPGDQVTVTAGGCVQTGGFRKTWKRYVNPSGKNSDRFYHGLINLPGVTAQGKLERIVNYVDKTFTVQGGPLVLGYEDDDYSDNGYNDHDDGTEDQCKHVGAAWVKLHIKPAAAPPPPTEVKPLDVVAGALDYNGLPLNPRWGREVKDNVHPDAPVLCGGLKAKNPLGTPPCSDQFTWTNVATLNPNHTICGETDGWGDKVHGHLNWTPATYMGTVHWEDHALDDDYDWAFWPANQSGLTTANPNAIHMEFDSDETVDNISAGLWNTFHDMVDLANPTPGIVFGDIPTHHPEAIAIGLLGLDVEHDSYSELHPLFGLAIHVKDDPADDQWAILSRNWGNEGFCSDTLETLEIDSLTFFIPHANAGVTTKQAAFYSNNDGKTFSVTPQNGGALVTFYLGRPDERTVIMGDIHLTWTNPPLVSARSALLSPFGRGGQSEAAPANETERNLSKLVSALPAPTQQQFRHLRMPARFQARFAVNKVDRAPEKRNEKPRVGSARDPRKHDRDVMRVKLLCDAYKGQIPGMPANTCAGMSTPPAGSQ